MVFKHFFVKYKMDDKEKEAYLKAESFVVGRSAECDIPISSHILSRQHVRVEFKRDRIYVTDLGSTNGTYLNGHQLKPNVAFEYIEGNELFLGAKKECRFEIKAIVQREELESSEDRLLGLERPLTNPPQKDRAAAAKPSAPQPKKKAKVQQPSKSSAPAKVLRSPNVDDSNGKWGKLPLWGGSKQSPDGQNKHDNEVLHAQKKAEAILQKAKREIEIQKSLVQKEMFILTKEKKDQAESIVQEAQRKAEDLHRQGDEELERTRKAAHEEFDSIIAEAVSKKERLVEESETIEQTLASRRQEVEALNDSIAQLKKDHELNLTTTSDSRASAIEAQKKQQDLIGEVADLEKRASAALSVLEVRVPELESKQATLEESVANLDRDIRERKATVEHLEKESLAQRKEHDANVAQAKASALELESLRDKVSLAKDELQKTTILNEERQAQMERDEKSQQQRLAEASRESANSIEKLRQRAEKEISVNIAKAKEKALSMVADAQQEKESLVREMKALQQETQDEANRAIDKATAQAQRLNEEALEVSASLKAAAEQECEAKRQLLSKEEKQLRREWEKEGASLLSESQAEAQEIINQAKQEAQKSVDEAHLIAQAEVKEARKKASDIKDSSQAEFDKICQEVKAQAEAEKARVMDKAQREAAKIVQKAKKTGDRDLATLHADIKKTKQQTEEEIRGLRTQALASIEKQRQSFEKELKERYRVQAIQLKKELHDVLRVRMTPYLKDQEALDVVGTMFERSINAIVLEEVDEDLYRVDNYSDIDPSLAQSKVKKFYVYGVLGFIALLLFFIYLPSMKKVAKDSGRNIATQADKDAKQKMAQKQKENSYKKEFRPKQVDKYFDTYTERVMYTTGYVQVELDSEYRKQWILALQDYFANELRLNETQLVPFIAREATLIRELNAAKASINGNFVEEGKKRLLEIEKLFMTQLKKTLKKPSHLKKIMKFKKTFFQKNKEKFL